MDRVEKYAESYADGCHPSVRLTAKRSFMVGYDQCVEDMEPDMDEYQKRLSEAYSDMKVKYVAKVEKVLQIEKLLAAVKEGKVLPSEIDTILNGYGYKTVRT